MLSEPHYFPFRTGKLWDSVSPGARVPQSMGAFGVWLPQLHDLVPSSAKGRWKCHPVFLPAPSPGLNKVCEGALRVTEDHTVLFVKQKSSHWVYNSKVIFLKNC